MLRAILILPVLLMGCGVAEQPEWAKTVAAYEVPLPTAADKARFLELLSEEAEAQGFHVDSATADELRIQSEASPITFNATVWRGEDDDETIASAMDFKDHIGRIWLSFSRGSDPNRMSHFRETLIPRIEKLWPRPQRYRSCRMERSRSLAIWFAHLQDMQSNRPPPAIIEAGLVRERHWSGNAALDCLAARDEAIWAHGRKRTD